MFNKIDSKKNNSVFTSTFTAVYSRASYVTKLALSILTSPIGFLLKAVNINHKIHKKTFFGEKLNSVTKFIATYKVQLITSIAVCAIGSSLLNENGYAKEFIKYIQKVFSEYSTIREQTAEVLKNSKKEFLSDKILLNDTDTCGLKEILVQKSDDSTMSLVKSVPDLLMPETSSSNDIYPIAVTNAIEDPLLKKVMTPLSELDSILFTSHFPSDPKKTLMAYVPLIYKLSDVSLGDSNRKVTENIEAISSKIIANLTTIKKPFIEDPKAHIQYLAKEISDVAIPYFKFFKGTITDAEEWKKILFSPISIMNFIIIILFNGLKKNSKEDEVIEKIDQNKIKRGLFTPYCKLKESRIKYKRRIREFYNTNMILRIKVKIYRYQKSVSNEVSFEDKIKKMEAFYEDEIEKMKTFYEDEIEEIKAFYEAEIEEIKAFYEAEIEEMNELNIKFNEKLRKIMRAFEEKISKLDEEKTSLKIHIDKFQAQKSISNGSEIEEIEKMKTFYEAKIKKEKTVYEAKIKKEETVYEAEIEEMKTVYEAEIEEIEKMKTVYEAEIEKSIS